jgi:hypothetical protein
VTGLSFSVPVTPSGFRFAVDLDGTGSGGHGFALAVRLLPPPWRKPCDVEAWEQHARVGRRDGRPGYGTEPSDSGRRLGLGVVLPANRRPVEREWGLALAALRRVVECGRVKRWRLRWTRSCSRT